MGFFKDIGNRIADTAKGIKTKIDSKIQEHKENKEQQKILNEKFKAEKNALVFTVYFRNGKKQNFTGLLYHGDHIIRLDYKSTLIEFKIITCLTRNTGH